MLSLGMLMANADRGVVGAMTVGTGMSVRRYARKAKKVNSQTTTVPATTAHNQRGNPASSQRGLAPASARRGEVECKRRPWPKSAAVANRFRGRLASARNKAVSTETGRDGLTSVAGGGAVYRWW